MSGLTGDWDKLNNLLNPARLTQKLHAAAARVGNYGASEVKKGIQSGAPGGQKFAPNSPATIKRKGSSKPLIEQGDLVGSITYALPDPDTVWVGVKKTAKKKGKNGKEKDLANIAAVHEFGCTIPIKKKNGETRYLFIPPRPFLRPVLNSPEFREKIAEIYLKAVKEAFIA